MKRNPILISATMAVLLATPLMAEFPNPPMKLGKDTVTVHPATAPVSVKDFGAKGDGIALDHTAINKAIAAVSAAGGGTVVVPPGEYLCGSIRLTNNLRLVLQKGAVIRGASNDRMAYDETEPFTPPAYQDGGHCYFRNSLLWAENMTNITLEGEGMIHGGGMKDWNPILDRMGGLESSKKTGVVNLGPDGKPLVNNGLPPVRIGNKTLALKSCRYVTVKNLTFAHGGHFAILATGVDDLVLSNLTIDTQRDGVDIDSCRRVLMTHCKVNAPFDDAICPKSSYALGELRLCEDLKIVHCEVYGFAEGTLIDGTRSTNSRNHVGRIKFGTEGTGGYRNCLVAHCYFETSMGLVLGQADGGILENVIVSNITMKDTRKYGIYLATGERNRTPVAGAVSRMKNIVLTDITATGIDPRFALCIMGTERTPVEGVRLRNIRLESLGGGRPMDAKRPVDDLGDRYPKLEQWPLFNTWGFFARHVKGLTVSNLSLELTGPDARPALVFESVTGATLDSSRAARPQGSPAPRYENVKDLVIRNSDTLKGEGK